MAETTRKRFNISEKSAKNGIYSCPPLEPLPSRNIPVDCFCERRPKSLISRRGTQAKRALNIVGIDKQNTGLIHVTNLFPYFPVLDLLHAHGDSPEERCSSRLVPFAIRTRFAPSVRKSAIPLFPLPKRPHAQNPCPIRLSAGGGGGEIRSTQHFPTDEVRSYTPDKR